MKDNFNWSDEQLDQKLNSQDQLRVREVVRGLPEDTLSLAWRSELTTRLHAEAARKKKLDLFGWIWKPAAGLALAGALAIAFVARIPSAEGVPVASQSNVENALVDSYVDNTASWEVGGDSITFNEAKDVSNLRPLPVEWEQEDVGAAL